MSGSPIGACVAIAAGLAVAGCHFGPWAVPDTDVALDTESESDPVDYHGPRLTSVWPAPGATDVPRDAVITLRFSDQLDGHSVSPAAFRLYSGPLSRWISTSFDPVRQELRLWSSPALTRKVEWVLEFREGLLGLDGELVAPGEVTRFRTNENTSNELPIAIPSYKEQVAPLLASRCAGCHSEDSAAADLILDSTDGLAKTAIGATATGWPLWRRVEPQRPDLSYLIFKIMGWKGVTGQRMPSTFTNEPSDALTVAEQRLISDWIAVGLPFFDQQDTDS